MAHIRPVPPESPVFFRTTSDLNLRGTRRILVSDVETEADRAQEDKDDRKIKDRKMTEDDEVRDGASHFFVPNFSVLILWFRP